jgi:limonene 1,2-monooxygenase
MTLPRHMKFGIFLGPFHPAGQNPTLAMDRDLELIEWMDYLGYDEAWIGEHHSAGWEIIASPEVFIAAAARSTRTIKLGTGVSSLPYHHPYILIDRIVQLDHMTRGRVMFGVGPGALTSDAYQLGIAAEDQRPRMDESMQAIMALLRGDEPVTMKTDWFELREARLQLRPYSEPCFHIAVASAFSPAGPVLAGRYGLGMLSVSAYAPGALTRMADQWKIAEDSAAQHGQTINRDEWRLVLPIHVAETRQQAFDDVREGYAHWQAGYFQDTLGQPGGEGSTDIEAVVSRGGAIVGTPDDAIAAIHRLDELSGGFGGLLGMAHECANRERTLRSYELWARYVAPCFQGSAAGTNASRDWVAGNRKSIFAPRQHAVLKAFTDAGITVPPGVLDRMQRGAAAVGDVIEPSAPDQRSGNGTRSGA